MLPSLSLVPHDGPQAVRVQFAAALPSLAVSALRLLEGQREAAAAAEAAAPTGAGDPPLPVRRCSGRDACRTAMTPHLSGLCPTGGRPPLGS